MFYIGNRTVETFSDGLGVLALLAESGVAGTLYAEGGLPVAYTKGDGSLVIV